LGEIQKDQHGQGKALRGEDFQTLAERVMKLSTADDVTVGSSHRVENLTRFGENRITQNMSRKVTSLTVGLAFGSRKGSADTTDLTEDGLKAVVKRAEELGKQSSEDPEYVPPLGRQVYPGVPERFFKETAEASADLRAEAVCKMVSQASRLGMTAAGRFATGWEARGWATNKGLFAFHRRSFAEGALTAMDRDASGYAQGGSENLQEMSSDGIAAAAVKKAEVGRNPIDFEPGGATVILEPLAVADLMAYMLYLMDGRAADEGRSFFTGKIGERILDERLTLTSDPTDPHNPSWPFLEEGLSANPLIITEKGILKNLFYDRNWAHQKGIPPTGRRWFCTLTGGEEKAEDLLKKVERGILVTRFWYIRYVDPMKVLVTGMTRDGTYLVENGRVTRAIKNMRFNESVVDVLSSVGALGSPVRTSMRFLVPPLVVENFNFVSSTLF
jgi:predicted Zn-dependent protease